MAGKQPSAKAILLMVVVFVLGCVVGALGVFLGGHMREMARHERMIDRLSADLKLSAQQRSQILGILADGHKRFDAVFQQSQDQARAQYDAIRQDVHNRIRAVLSPDQQTKFDAFIKELNAEHRIHPPVPRPRRQGP